jgi:hypothetical protein
MRTKTEQILAAMNILSQVVFIGLLIQAGAILVSYGVSITNPNGARNLYMGLDLYNLRQFNFWHYTLTISFMVALPILKAYVAFLVVKAIARIKLSNPFRIEVSRLLERISYFIFGIWVLAMLYNAHIAWLSKITTGLQQNWISGEFILLAGVIFVISQIFKKGVEIQSENELTV